MSQNKSIISPNPVLDAAKALLDYFGGFGPLRDDHNDSVHLDNLRAAVAAHEAAPDERGALETLRKDVVTMVPPARIRGDDAETMKAIFVRMIDRHLAAPPAVPEGCVINPLSSACCSRGTRCCDQVHTSVFPPRR